MTHDLIEELHDNWQDYSWTTMGIFRGPDGLLWSDCSGCSCNGPWEYDVVYFPLTEDTWEDFVKNVRGFPADEADKAAFISAANRALRQG